MLVTLLGIVTDVMEMHPKKVASPIPVTLWGIIVLGQPATNLFVAVSIIPLQSLRESYVVLPSSTFIDFKLLHTPKAYHPILVTLLGIMIEVKFSWFAKAYSYILVTPLGIIVF